MAGGCGACASTSSVPAGKPPAPFHIAMERRKRGLDMGDRLILERARLRLGLAGVPGEDVPLRFFFVGRCFGGHHVGGKPAPDRLERHAGDATRMLAAGAVVDEEWLERGKEQPLRIADARRQRAPMRCRLAQFLKDEADRRQFLPAQPAALELRHQQSPRLRFQFPQVVAQPIDREPVVGHPAPTRTNAPAVSDSASAIKNWFRMSEIGCQMSEVRCQRSDVRDQKRFSDAVI